MSSFVAAAPSFPKLARLLDQEGFDPTHVAEVYGILYFKQGCYYFCVRSSSEIEVAISEIGDTLHHHKDFRVHTLEGMVGLIKSVIVQDPAYIQNGLLKNDHC